MGQESKPPYGYYLIGCHYEHGYHDEVFEFFEIRKGAELEGRIAELLGKEYQPYREEDIHVIRGSEVPFMVEKEVVRVVSVRA